MDKVNKDISVLDIDKNKTTLITLKMCTVIWVLFEMMQCEMFFLRVAPFKIHFLIHFWSHHNTISMANANINALYAGSLGIKIPYFIPEYFYILYVVPN